MTDPQRATEALLAEKPAAEAALRELVRIDEDGPWTFDDAGVDSGTFGEIVSRGIVERDGDGDAYRLADRDAVRAALDGDAAGDGEATGDARGGVASTPAVDVGTDVDVGARLAALVPSRKHAGALAGGLALVVALRVLLIGSVFRGGDVVLAGNDPWGYRYWVELLLASDVHPLALGALPGLARGGISTDWLYLISLWWPAAAAGGTPGAAAVVLAVTPVVLAALTAVAVYLIAVRLTADRRVGLAAVVMLAFTPIHAYRTMIGFADHHAFDHFLVSVTVLGLVLVATARTDRTLAVGGRDIPLPASPAAWVGALALGGGIAAHVLAWRGGPILIVPVTAYAAYLAAFDRGAARTPAGDAVFLVGLAIGAALALVPHALFGWPSALRAVTPVLLLAASAGMLAIGTAADRLDLSPRVRLGTVLGTVAVVGAASFVLPVVSAGLAQGLAYFTRTTSSNIAETLSLFGGPVGTVFGPVLFFGLVLFLAAPYVAVALWRATGEYRPAWVAVGAYTVYFVLLAGIQLRFAGPLAVVAAVFAGIGFVHLAGRLDLIPAPSVFAEGRTPGTTAADGGDRGDRGDRVRSFTVPDRATASYLLVLLLLVTSFSLVQIPVKQTQLAIDDDTYRTATWIESYADERDLASSDRYVFSQWGRNRVYNHFVSGDSRSYAYAQENFARFLGSSASDQWYHRLQGRAGFVVTEPHPDTPPQSMHARLHRRYGSAGEGADGSGHYRVVHVESGGERVVSTLVPGATVVGVANPGGTVTVTTNVSLGGTTTTYERRAEANRYGVYDVTVAYPGRYAAQGRTVEVSAGAVDGGGRYVLHDRRGVAHWPLDAGSGRVAADRIGGYGARIAGGEWTAGATGTGNGSGSALRFADPGDGAVANGSFDLGERSVTLSFWIRGDPGAAESRYPTVVRSQGADGSAFGAWARTDAGDFGVRFDDADGTSARNFGIKTATFPGWTHVVAVLDRDAGELRLYRNGTLVATTDAGEVGPVRTEGLEIGTWRGGRHGVANAAIDDLRIRDSAASTADVERWYNRSAPASASPVAG